MIAALLFAAATAVPPRPPHPCANVKNPPLCRDLIEIYDRDQAVRKKWIANPTSAALIREMETVDKSNLGRVKAILNQFAWPGKALVGEKASAAAWTIVHHADVATQKLFLDIMMTAANAGELRWALLAQTIDRIAVREGRKQTYGTQFHDAGGVMIPDPIEDEANVDERRAKVGLPPLAEFSRTLNSKAKK
jgi:hypothetical protein